MNFYDKVKKLCNENGIAITTLVTELGFSRSTATTWRNTGAAPRASTIKKIAERFNVSAEWLASDDDKMPENGNYTDGLTKQEREIIDTFRMLSLVDKAKTILYMNDLLTNKGDD